MEESAISTKKKHFVFIIVLVIILFGLYWKTFSYDLVWDDNLYIKQGLLFTEKHSLLDSFKYGYFREQMGMKGADFYYRPLLTASFMIENSLWGLKTFTLRLTNLLIYIFSLFFIFLFLKRQYDKNYFPEIATSLFALYPINVDHIVWVVGRGDLFLLLWGSLSLLLLDLFIRKRKYPYGFFTCFFFLLGILSKESFAFFLPILIVYELIKRKKLSIPVHASNVLIILFYFVLKNRIVGIKNLGLLLYPDLGENLRLALATLGYYSRSLFFPVRYDMFLPIRDITNLFYYFVGILTILLLAYLVYRARKEQDLIVPLALIIVFLGGHVILTFSHLYPFKIYARYMTIPALGFIWILTRFLVRQKEKVRYYLTLIILIVFIPSIILNGLSYRNQFSYWERALKSSPQNSYALFQIANLFREQKNYLSAELNLNKVLSLDIEKETAITVSLLYSDLEFNKAEYSNVFKWLKSIEDFETSPDIQLAPFIRYHVNYKKAMVYLSQGDVSAAENLFKENIKRYPNIKESYSELYDLYIGSDQWDKAKALEPRMKDRFPSFFKDLNTTQAKNQLDSCSPDQRIAFYIRFRNFAKAISLVEAKAPLDLDHKILLAKLYYWEGREEEGKKVIEEILKAGSSDVKTLNAIGYFYLRDLSRAKEAVVYFDQSLAADKSQPEIIYMDSGLKEQYLKQLRPVWK